MQKIAIPKLKVVVCGMEHAGTTLLAQLLRQHPHLETGYEVGALMHPNLSAYWNNSGQWKHYRDPTNRYVCCPRSLSPKKSINIVREMANVELQADEK